ncbi:MAG: hypothetical protein AAFO07_27325, partial [Bacteroidota bacterium]
NNFLSPQDCQHLSRFHQKQYGAKTANFSLEKKGKNHYLIIKGKSDEVIASSFPFAKKADEDKLKNRIMAFAKKLDEGNYLSYTSIVLDHPQGANFENDPYSLQLSIVIPNWTARFQNPGIQKLFEQIVINNSPAYLSVNFFWIGIERMKEFEDIYDAWIQLKSNEKADLEKLDDLSYKLMEMLLSFKKNSE